MTRMRTFRWALALPALLFAGSAAVFGADATCSVTTGAPPIQTQAPVTVRPVCYQGQLLSFDQDGVTRYACLNLPQGARQRPGGTRWPLLVYLHGSLTTPDSLPLPPLQPLRPRPRPHDRHRRGVGGGRVDGSAGEAIREAPPEQSPGYAGLACCGGFRYPSSHRCEAADASTPRSSGS